MDKQELEAINLVTDNAPDAIKLLENLEYDPIRALVEIDQRLKEEDAFQINLRNDLDTAAKDTYEKKLEGQKSPLIKRRGPSYSGINHTNVIAVRV